FINLTFVQQNDLLFKTIDHKQGISSKRISAVLQDSNGILWMGNRIAVDRYDCDKTIPFNLSRNSDVNQLAEDANQNIWAATYTGLFTLRKGEKELKNIEHPDHEFQEILEENVISIALFDDNTAYISTNSCTLLQFTFHPQGQIIPQSFQVISFTESQSSTMIINPSNKSLLLGTTNGLVLKLDN